MGVPPRGCGVWRDDQQGGFRGATTRGGGGAPRFGPETPRRGREEVARAAARRYQGEARGGISRDASRRAPRRVTRRARGAATAAKKRRARGGGARPGCARRAPGGDAPGDPARYAEEEPRAFRVHRDRACGGGAETRDRAGRRAAPRVRRRAATKGRARRRRIGVRRRIRRRIRRRAALRAPRVRGGPGRSGLQERPARGDRQRYDAEWRPRGRPRGRPRRVLRSRIARRNDGEGNREGGGGRARESRSVARRIAKFH